MTGTSNWFTRPRVLRLAPPTSRLQQAFRLVSLKDRIHFPTRCPIAVFYHRRRLHPPLNSFRRGLATQDTPTSSQFGPYQEEEKEIMGDTKSIASGTSTNSGKRKLSTPAYYAVKVGRTPGIYYNWADTQQQINGISAVYRKFNSLTDAEEFMKSSSNAPARPGKTKYYAVAVGHVPGIYMDWPTVQAQIKDCKGAKQKAFSSYEEAQRWLEEHRKNSSRPISLRGDLSETSSVVGKNESVAKKQKKNDGTAVPLTTIGDLQYDPGVGPLPLDAEDGFDRTIKYDPLTGTIVHKTQAELNAVKRQPTGDFSGPIEIYTDGSALGNGKVGARAGVGVYFGPDDARNVSEPLSGVKQTNQRAELTAIQHALDNAPIDRNVVIYTDSYYSINCCTEWFQKWENSGWKTTAGKPVDNRDLIEPIIARIRERQTCKADTKFTWVKGHSTNQGNIMADQLAVNGAHEGQKQLLNAAKAGTPEVRSTPLQTTDDIPPEFKMDGLDNFFAEE